LVVEIKKICDIGGKSPVLVCRDCFDSEKEREGWHPILRIKLALPKDNLTKKKN